MARLSRALARLPVDPVAARVRFTDTTGPKGGPDIRCAVFMELPHRPCVLAERVALTPRLAFDLSYDCLVRQLERHRVRAQTRGPP